MSFDLKTYQRNYQRQYRKNKSKVYLDYLERNKEKIKQYQKEYREKNKDRAKEDKRRHYISNKAKIIERERVRYNYKYATDIQFKIKSLLRGRLLHAVGKEFKRGSAIDLLGCTIEEFKTYISNQFKQGMSWGNYGIKGWHLDHIKPCASFDLTKEEDQRRCFHYTNFQPLWALENYSKGAKYDKL